MGNLPVPQQQEQKFWKSIVINCEARGKDITLGIIEETSVKDVLQVFEERCKNEGINIQEWKKKKGGDPNGNLVLVRKKDGGNALLPPAFVFSSLADLSDGEIFEIKSDGKVGGNYVATKSL
jgi:hypothetical protein